MSKVLIYKIEANLGYDAFRVTYFDAKTGIIEVVEEMPDGKVIGGYTSYDTGLSEKDKEIVELKADLKMKAENGCCIVEHGWRISAEHEVKDQSLTIRRQAVEIEELRQQRNTSIAFEMYGEGDAQIKRITRLDAEIEAKKAEVKG